MVAMQTKSPRKVKVVRAASRGSSDSVCYGVEIIYVNRTRDRAKKRDKRSTRERAKSLTLESA